jgi:hypothetical protein
MLLNFKYKAAQKRTPTGCVNHSIGVAQPSVDIIYGIMNTTTVKWGVNAILGDFHKGEGKILVTLPLDYVPAGCGSGTKGSWNTTHIQWEIAEPAGHTYSGGTMVGYDVEKNQDYFDRMWKLLVAWNVYCANKFGYDASMIADHSESYKAGYGSNHTDLGHWLPKHNKSMDMLREEVMQIMGTVSKTTSTTSTDNSKEIWNFFKGKGFSDYATAGILGNLYDESALNPKKFAKYF